MSAHLFRRYVWLLDQVNRGGMTFKKISRQWANSSLNDRPGEPLALKTFHNHIEAIEEIFDLRIRCQRQGGYVYVLEKNENANISKTQRELLDHLLLSNIHLERQHAKYIIMPKFSLHRLASTIFEAIAQRRKIKILWGWDDGKNRVENHWVELEPYYLKGFTVCKSSEWFVYGLGSGGQFQAYELNNITAVELLDERFIHPETPFEEIANQIAHTPVNAVDDDDSLGAYFNWAGEELDLFDE